MRLSEIEKKARALGIKDTWKYSKKDLIKKIQKTEGNFDCFATAINFCSQNDCLWRIDCLHR
ncbi:MAG: SAP domain-containing protein [Candidatus Omnitrophica bacterium]|nr:SAP domain-containing protein [Candidatus Omnitrophota bacterium]